MEKMKKISVTREAGNKIDLIILIGVIFILIGGASYGLRMYKQSVIAEENCVESASHLLEQNERIECSGSQYYGSCACDIVTCDGKICYKTETWKFTIQQ